MHWKEGCLLRVLRAVRRRMRDVKPSSKLDDLSGPFSISICSVFGWILGLFGYCLCLAAWTRQLSQAADFECLWLD